MNLAPIGVYNYKPARISLQPDNYTTGQSNSLTDKNGLNERSINFSRSKNKIGLKTLALSLMMLVSQAAKASSNITKNTPISKFNTENVIPGAKKVFGIKDSIPEGTTFRINGKEIRLKKGETYSDTIFFGDGGKQIITVTEKGSKIITYDKNGKVTQSVTNGGNVKNMNIMGDNYGTIFGSENSSVSHIGDNISITQTGNNQIQEIVIDAGSSNNQFGNNTTMIIQQGQKPAAKDTAKAMNSNGAPKAPQAPQNTPASQASQATKTVLQDGTEILKSGDKTITKYPDGTKTLTQPGKTTTIKPDGTKIIDQGNGAQITTIKPDGTKIINQGNGGQVITIKPDGSKTINQGNGAQIISVDKDGNTTIQRAQNSSTQTQTVVPKANKGGKIDEINMSDGEIIISKDGKQYIFN